MELDIKRLKTAWSDTVLVKQLSGNEVRRGLLVPKSVLEDEKKKRKLWRARIVRFGVKVDFEEWGAEKLKEGDVVYIDSVALDCPRFFMQNESGESDAYVFVRDEDLVAVELNHDDGNG